MHCVVLQDSSSGKAHRRTEESDFRKKRESRGKDVSYSVQLVSVRPKQQQPNFQLYVLVEHPWLPRKILVATFAIFLHQPRSLLPPRQ